MAHDMCFELTAEIKSQDPAHLGHKLCEGARLITGLHL